MTNAVAIAQYGSTSPNKNRIINGAMVISQRNGTTGTLITADNQYGLDRWTYRTSLTSKLTSTQSTTAPAGFSYSNQTTVTTSATPSSGDYVSLKQSIEGYNVADLNWGSSNAKAVNLSFWVYSSVTGTYGARLVNNDATQSWVFQYTITSANTWTSVTIPVTGPTSGTWLTTNGIGIAVQFDLGSGSAFATATTNAWISTDANHVTGNVQLIANSGANWYITGVQLEAGTTASPFEYRQYGTEFLLCQRYYQIAGAGATGKISGTTLIGVGVQYKVPMRINGISCTLTTTTVQVGDAFVATPTTSSASITYLSLTSFSAQGGAYGFEVQIGGFAGLTASNTTILYTNCLGLSAEL